MRRSWILALFVATAFPLSASKHVTVAQLQQALNTAISAHKPDAEIARQIGGFELTERLTKATLASSMHVWFRAPKGRGLSNCSLTGRLFSTRQPASCRMRQLLTAQSKFGSWKLREGILRKRCLACQTFLQPG
jgi:hypothetical protein